jgi:protein FrlC
MSLIYMKLGMFTYGYMRFSLERAFRDASRFGYDGIEIWGGRPHAYPFDLEEMGIGEIRELSSEYDTSIIGYTPELNMYPYNMMIGSERMRRESIEYIKTSMNVAKEMEAGFTLISAGHAGYETPRSEYWPRLIKNLRELASHAEDIGLDLVLEPLTQYETNVIVTCNDLVEALDEVDSRRLMGMCDLCPPFCNHEPIMTYFDKLGQRMRHMHIIDSDGYSDTHWMPGEGRIPLRELFREIEATSYDEYCTIELVSQYINEPTLGSAMAIRRIKKLLEG